MMPSSSQQPQHAAGQQPIGRSQSAFNFLLSKAKIPFSSSSSSSSGLNTSTSLSSLPGPNNSGSNHQVNAGDAVGHGINEDPFVESVNHLQYHRQLQQQYPAPHGPSMAAAIGRGPAPQPNMGHAPRSSTSDSYSGKPGSTYSRPSMSDETSVSSPTKRSFFGGMGRDRKVSNASASKAPVIGKNGYGHSPLGRGLRQESAGSSYALFSKSQSDLHARAEFPSPGNAPVELPKIPSPYAQNVQAVDRGQYLRSPSPGVSYSRSVDDLNTTDQPSSPFPTTPSSVQDKHYRGQMAGSLQQGGGGNWGEQGVVVGGEWRPSDMGTLASSGNSSQGRPVPGSSRGDASGNQAQLSGAPSHSGGGLWPVMLPPPSSAHVSAPSGARLDGRKHARKSSKLTHLGGGKDPGAHGKGMVTGSLAMSLGLAGIAGGSSGGGVANQNSHASNEPVPLPPGAVFQGFLGRNTNISLSLAQLTETESSKGKDKEKDISKGWKPYRVVLQDGKLYFFKPPSNVSDEVKALFPTALVWNSTDRNGNGPSRSAGSSYAAQIGMDASGLVGSGLGKNELLLATSSNKDGSSAQSSPSFGPVRQRGLPGRRTPIRANSSSTSVTAEPEPIDAPAVARVNKSDAWAGSARHPALTLVDAADAPLGWVHRIQSATSEALADEFVRATQLPRQLDAAATRAQTDAFAVTALVCLARSAQGPVPFLRDVVRLVQAQLDSLDGLANAALCARVMRLVDLAYALGLPTTSGNGAECLADLQTLARVAGMDEETLGKLEAARIAASQELARGRHVPVDWLAKGSEVFTDSRPPLKAMLTSRTITGETLLELEPLEVAQQVQAFHSDRLRCLSPPRFSAFHLIDAKLSETVSMFSFDWHRPHPLTQLVMSHLIGDRDPEQAAAAPIFNQSGARYRASLLRHWIAVASYLLKLGDVAGWLAVAVALCSRPVTRLEQTWRYLAEDDRLLVAKEWAPQVARLRWTEGIETQVRPLFTGEEGRTTIRTRGGTEVQVVPFLGNAPVRLKPSSAPPSLETGVSASLDIAARAQDSEALLGTAQQWTSARRTAAEAEHNTTAIAAVTEPIAEYQLCLQAALQSANITDLNSYMARSFHLERKALGNYISAPTTATAAQIGATASHSLVPLLFPEPLPHLSLLDSSKVLQNAFGLDKRLQQSTDPYATVSARNLARPGLSGSPLVRSSAFSPPFNGRSARTCNAFSGVHDWNQAGASIEESCSIIKVGNELILKTVHEPSLSLPSSPMTGKRFSSDFGRASRPLSQVSKRSSLPASNRSSIVETVVPVQVVVKAATLERMIDVLAMGVQHINVKGTEDLAGVANDGVAPRRTKLTMDMESYRTAFLATYRSLCSPSELFQHLQKRFAAAVNASKEMALLDTYQISSQYPSWTSVTPAGSHVEPIDWEVVYRIRMGVVLTLRLWIDRCPQDFADDDRLYQLVHAFLHDPGMERSTEDPDQSKVALAVAQINGMFVQSIMGANARNDDKSYALASPVHASDSIDAVEVDFDALSSKELVDFLESIATVFFDKIVERDLQVVSEVFESQASHPTAWYAARHSDTREGDDDGLPIFSMYSLLDVLKTPAAGSKGPLLQQHLPAAVRDALAAQTLLRGWVAIHIVEKGLGVQKRQARLEKLLDAVWICRARMARLRSEDSSSLSQDGAAPFREATVGSFVESAILGTLITSESRIFLRAWQGVALSRGATGDTLHDLFPQHISPAMRSASAAASTPDVGWILRCLAEAITRPPSSPSSDAVDPSLIDFERRKTVWAIIEGAVRVRPPYNSPALIELAGARLKAMQTALSHVTWDRRAFREDAAREASQAPPIGPQSTLRPSSSAKALPGVSRQQQEKLRRDRTGLSALDAAAASRPLISSRNSSMQAVAADRNQPPSVTSTTGSTPVTSPPPTTTAAPDKATIRARRMTALFRGAVRPLMPEKGEPSQVRSVAELMRLTPIQKPSLVAGLGGAQLAPWNNSQRSFVLHLTSEEGAKYLLQAPNQAEMNSWYTHISRTAQERAPLRPAELRKAGIVRSNVQNPSVAPLYGVPLPAIVEREGSAVPMAIEKMFAEIEARGLREQGIYRISGAKSAIEGLRDALNKQPLDSIDLANGEYSDVNTIAGAIKHWFRDLPEPVITFASYDAIIAAERIENHDERLGTIREVIWSLPKCHFDLLRRTAEHLARVVDEGTYNLMAPHNIGLVFGTSLLNPPPGPSSMAISFGNLGKAAHIVKIIVTMHEWLFEPEPEPEPEPELELESGPEIKTETVVEGVSDTGAGTLRLNSSTLREEEEGDDQEDKEDSKELEHEAEEWDHETGMDGRGVPTRGAVTVAMDPAREAAIRRRHTHMFGDLASLGLGVGAQGLKQSDASADSLSTATMMQRSLSSDSEPLTPVDRFNRVPGLPLMALSSSPPLSLSSSSSSLQKLSSPTEPLPAAAAAAAAAEERSHAEMPSITLTQTEDGDSNAGEGRPLSLEDHDERVDSDDAHDDDDNNNNDDSIVDDDAQEEAPLAAPRTATTATETAAGLEVASGGSAAVQQRARRAREGYRDSVFSSYSIYADCFDGLNLSSASPSGATRLDKSIDERPS